MYCHCTEQHSPLPSVQWLSSPPPSCYVMMMEWNSGRVGGIIFAMLRILSLITVGRSDQVCWVTHILLWALDSGGPATVICFSKKKRKEKKETSQRTDCWIVLHVSWWVWKRWLQGNEICRMILKGMLFYLETLLKCTLRSTQLHRIML